jgi:parallel beta-helix repeat protein
MGKGFPCKRLFMSSFALALLVGSLFANLPIHILPVYAPPGTPISGPTTISSPGYYYLTNDIVDSPERFCINITSSDVIFDGNGFMVDAPEYSWGNYGVHVYNSTRSLSNVTVKNLAVSQWEYGVAYQDIFNGGIENNNITLCGNGVHLHSSFHIIIDKNSILQCGNYGIILLGSYGRDSPNNDITNNKVTRASISVNSDNNYIANNSVSEQKGHGIDVYGNNNTLYNNQLSSNWVGLYSSGSHNRLDNNDITSNTRIGLYLDYAFNITLTNNVMTDNGYNFYLNGDVDGGVASHFDHNINTSNTVDGKPIYYVKDTQNLLYDVSTNAGLVYCIGCDNVTVRDLNPSNNGYGVFFWRTNNSRVENISATSNEDGVFLAWSNNNTLEGNLVNSSYLGILLRYSCQNKLLNNTVTNSDDGFSIYDLSNYNEISNNTAHDNEYGFFLYWSHNNTLRNNTASDSYYYGIILQSYPENNTLTRNRILNSRSYGIYLYSGDNNKIYDKRISKNLSNSDRNGLLYIKNRVT